MAMTVAMVVAVKLAVGFGIEIFYCVFLGVFYGDRVEIKKRAAYIVGNPFQSIAKLGLIIYFVLLDFSIKFVVERPATSSSLSTRPPYFSTMSQPTTSCLRL